MSRLTAFTNQAATSLTISLVIAAMVVGCSKPERPNPAGPGIPQNHQPKLLNEIPNTKNLLKDSGLTAEQQSIPLATIGARIITLGELEARLRQQPDAIQAQYRTLNKRKEFLLNWVKFEVLVEEARRQGLDKDPEVVETVKQQMVRRLVRESVLKTITTKDITDAEVQAYYDNNVRLYHKPLQVEVRHLLLKDEARAKRVRKELLAGSMGSAAKLSALWGDYIKRVSEDKASVPFLGTLGMVSETAPKGATAAELARLNSIPQNLRAAALALKPYTLSEALSSDRGWHVMMAVSRSPAVDKSIEQVKGSIKRRLLKRKRNLARKSFVDELMTKSKIDYNDEAIRLLPPPKIKNRKPTKADLNVKTGAHHGHNH
ncbi:MAG TPA: hypothetical protein DCQ06_14440 [Myxococcales bacterium]|nr:hypothetical protein [Myxococcales bacterium]HAN32789.1 hypothetical protein [Myxococcales bacterium]